jgi:phosphatidylinositol glycan class C protein
LLLGCSQLIFFHLWSGSVSVASVVLCDAAGVAVVVVAAFAGRCPRAPADLPAAALRTSLTSLLFAFLLLVLAPILKTLTQDVSSDTIWALAMALAGAHLVAFDYARPATHERHDATLALNAAMFAAILLASRLPSVGHVFALLLVATQLFALLPLARDALLDEPAARVLTLAWVALNALALVTTASRLLALVFVAAVAFIGLVCPAWLQHSQKYKHEIQGPWDIAKVAALNH